MTSASEATRSGPFDAHASTRSPVKVRRVHRGLQSIRFLLRCHKTTESSLKPDSVSTIFSLELRGSVRLLPAEHYPQGP